MTHKKVFVWLTGQSDNIGDSALRRAYAKALSEAGELRAWGGDTSRGYISGLGLEDAALSTSFASWRRELADASRSGDAVFAFNAGEFVVTREYFFGMLSIIPALLRLKARGGRLVWLGVAVKKTKRGFTFPFFWLARHADLLRWRDTASSDIMRVDAPTMPDWAFALESQGRDNGERGQLAVSLRSDRGEPLEDWIDATQSLAARLGLRLVVVVQVQRDGPLARRLAEKWDCALVEWRSDSHAEQESVVREVYRQSDAIISDRLHALIIAATEGAVPLGWTTVGSSKIDTHFAAVGLNGVALGGQTSVEALRRLDQPRLEQHRRELGSVLTRARQQLAAVGRDLVRTTEESVSHR